MLKAVSTFYVLGQTLVWDLLSLFGTYEQGKKSCGESWQNVKKILSLKISSWSYSDTIGNSKLSNISE